MSTTQDPVELAKSIMVYFESDVRSYQKVLADSSFPSRLAVGMVTTAAAVLDFYSWIMYADGDRGQDKRFESFLTDSRGFFAADPDFNRPVVYNLIRCGVVHQFYPKLYTQLIALDDPHTLVNYAGKNSINAFGFMQGVLAGITLAQQALDVESCPTCLDQMKARLSRRNQQESDLAKALPNGNWYMITGSHTATGTTPPPAIQP